MASDDFHLGSPPSTPVEWLIYLQGRLSTRLAQIRRYADYYEGRQSTMPFSQSLYNTAFGDAFRDWSDNFCGLIVDSVNERLAVEGFRMTSDPDADQDAQQIWLRNDMTVQSSGAHLDAMLHGESYAIVWAGVDGEPIISCESAEHVIVQYRAGSRTEIEAAAKFYSDDWGRQYATLWTDEYVYTSFAQGLGWFPPVQADNPLKRVPVVPISNRARLTGHPTSDLASVIPLQDAINKTGTDALVASEMAAFPARFVTGLEIVEDEAGNPIEPFRIAIDKVLQAEDPQAKFGQFQSADLQNYRTLIDMLTQHLAAISRIPSYMIDPSGQPATGEGAEAAEYGLVAKARERILHFGRAWVEVMRLCFAVKGDPRADAYGAEVIWREVENRSEAQHMDALVKLFALGVPAAVLWEKAGFTPQEIDRFPALLDLQEALIREYPSAISSSASQPAGATNDVAEMAATAPQGNAGNAARKQAGDDASRR
ncbi:MULTISPECIES: phage portal protein [unclassified Streptomyces]|uniref:phage portal protein n=1 Tax=unclassified Streptomyces TaxID=2593676 RepID=UPI0022AFB28D|nr:MULTISPECIES: phage portal protein [unclassified Streptomyces]MCZ4097319.1 phage portal protein [Streptomyces sp. H39-C1]MCZ4120623.1 phage portal protein [Streptomyces sp. H39-S7]